LIFNLFPRLVVKLGEDEKHVYDRGRLMFTEVAEIEKVTGQSYMEWERDLGRYSITAIAALLHVLRKRADMASDFGTMQFNAAELDCVPLHENDSEYTAQEIADHITGRLAGAAPDPTSATAAAVEHLAGQPTPATSTPGSSPSGSASAPGSGTSSPGATSSAASPTSTAS
jgi:hypothetical protein